MEFPKKIMGRIRRYGLYMADGSRYRSDPARGYGRIELEEKVDITGTKSLYQSRIFCYPRESPIPFERCRCNAEAENGKLQVYRLQYFRLDGMENLPEFDFTAKFLNRLAETRFCKESGKEKLRKITYPEFGAAGLLHYLPFPAGATDLREGLARLPGKILKSLEVALPKGKIGFWKMRATETAEEDIEEKGKSVQVIRIRFRLSLPPLLRVFAWMKGVKPDLDFWIDPVEGDILRFEEISVRGEKVTYRLESVENMPN